jgi:hypothetical protein
MKNLVIFSIEKLMIKTLEKTLANWKKNCQKNRKHSLVPFTDELLELTDGHQV